MEILEQLLEKGEKPNFTQAQFFALEYDSDPPVYRKLLQLMEKQFNLPKFEVNTPIEVQNFNPTQIQLAYAAEGVLTVEQCKELREHLERNYKLLPLTAETVLECLESASENAKPNFTQYQLKMRELNAVPVEWQRMRHLMEKKLDLEPLDDCAPMCTAYDCFRLLDCGKPTLCKKCKNVICKNCVKMGDYFCEDHRH